MSSETEKPLGVLALWDAYGQRCKEDRRVLNDEIARAQPTPGPDRTREVDAAFHRWEANHKAAWQAYESAWDKTRQENLSASQPTY